MDVRVCVALLCLLTAVTANCAPSRQKNETTVGWIFLAYDMPYLRQAIGKAQSYGVNQIQLSHDIVMEAEAVLEKEQLAKDINELARLGHSHGMKVYIWTHELSGVPADFARDGKVNLDDPALSDWLTDKYEKLFTVVPEIDGLVLTMSETQVRVFNDGAVTTAKSKTERVTWLVDTLYKTCRANGKKLIVRDWGNLGTGAWEDLQRIQQGLDASDPEVTIMTKYTAGDWYMNARNPLIGGMKQHRQIEEFDLAGEHHGQAIIPWAIPDLIKEEYTFAHKRGIIGAAGRVERSTNHVLGTSNEINLYAFSKLVRNPDANVQTIWQDWAKGRFGVKAAPHVISAMKRTRGIIDRIMYVQRIYFLQDHTAIPVLDYPTNHVRGSSAAYWDKKLGAVEAKILSPTREFAREVLAEKDEGIGMCEASLADIERAKPCLKPEDYKLLRSAFDRELIMAKTFRTLAEAYFEYALYKPGEDRTKLDAAVAKLDQAAQSLDAKLGKDFQWGIPGQPRSAASSRLRGFAEGIRQRTR